MSAALFWVNHRAKIRELSVTHALDLALMMMIGALLGGRLLHVLWEEPQYYLENPWAFLKIWQGGFVFYGGLFGAFALAAGWCFRNKQNLLIWLDFFAPVMAFAYAFGRIGCFLNGCCYGRICDLPWAIDGKHPTQIYAFALELVNLATLLWWEKRPHRRSGSVFYLWLALHAIGRLVVEAFRADDRGPMPLGFSVSSWISLLLLSFAISRMKNRFVSK